MRSHRNTIYHRFQVQVLEVCGSDGGTLYSTWSGDVHSAKDSAEVSVNGLYASKQNLRQEEEVLVSVVTEVPGCERVFVEPVSVDDWEILVKKIFWFFIDFSCNPGCPWPSIALQSAES